MGAGASAANDRITQQVSTNSNLNWSKPTGDDMDLIKSLVKCACSGEEEKLTLLLKQGLDPNSIESVSSR